jgi:hypothetical protein
MLVQRHFTLYQARTMVRAPVDALKTRDSDLLKQPNHLHHFALRSIAALYTVLGDYSKIRLCLHISRQSAIFAVCFLYSEPTTCGIRRLRRARETRWITDALKTSISILSAIHICAAPSLRLGSLPGLCLMSTSYKTALLHNLSSQGYCSPPKAKYIFHCHPRCPNDQALDLHSASVKRTLEAA